MIRILIYLLILAVFAYAGMLLVENPGHVTLVWYGKIIQAPAALLIGLVAVGAILVFSILRFVLGLPSFVRLAARQRRREKGYAALSRGLIALGAGDGRTASQAAVQARRQMKGDPLALVLRAQAAHLNGDAQVARSTYEELARRDDTKILGLRGLHADALRRGDEDAARHFASAAHSAAPLPWSAQAVLGHRAAEGDWEKALATVEAALAARLIDRATGERQRAVLETAIAYQKEQAAPDQALALARSAMRRAPDLVPAVALAARLLTRRGDIRKASKIVAKAWPRCPHPDLAQAYLDVRPGDSTQDRLDRARSLMGIASYDPVSRLTLARAALAAKDFKTARQAMAPLVAEGKRPSVRQCLIMAELEEAEHGDTGLSREWLARAARAPFDPAWIADGIVYDQWSPVSPTTGRLDAFAWQVPAERLGPAVEALPTRKPEALDRSADRPAIAHHEDAGDEPAPATAVHEDEAAASEPPVPLSEPPHVSPSVPLSVPLTPAREAPPEPTLIPAARTSSAPLFHRRVAEAEGDAHPLVNGATPPDGGEADAAASNESISLAEPSEGATKH